MTRMGQSMKQTFLQYKKLFLISALIGIVTIPVFNALVIQRDRNRNEVYGELFWTYGMEVYNFDDDYLRENFNVPEDSLLGEHLNITYEYPPLTLFFFAVVSGVYPGMYGLQHLFVNAVMFFFFNLNVLLIIHLGGRFREKRWFWFFVGGYYAIEWTLSVWGGKMEPVTNTLTLLSILLYKKKDWGKANFLLGFAVQMKVYPLLLLPYYIFKTRKKSLWFFVSLVLMGLILPGANGVFSGLTMHASNDFRYSIYVTNPLFFGFIFSNPLSAITLALFITYIIPTLSQVKKRENIYFVLLPAVFFIFRWMMMWYFFWPIPLAMAIDNEKDMKKYIKTLCVVTLLYCLGILINIDYYLTSNLLYDLGSHFNLENL